MVVVPETDLPEFAIQLWPGAVLIFQRNYVHGTPTDHFLATEIVSDYSIRPHPPVLVKGTLFPSVPVRQVFEEAAFYPARPEVSPSQGPVSS